MSNKINGDLTVVGSITATQLELTNASISNDNVKAGAAIDRDKMAVETSMRHGIDLLNLRIHDNLLAWLTASAGTDDLGITAGTLGTDVPTVRSGDGKATTIAQYARFQYTLPAEYHAGSDVTVQIKGGMITTISDDTATVDVNAYAHDGTTGVGSDLCTTAASPINTLMTTSATTTTFTVTGTNLTAGQKLDIRVAILITDAATGTAVIGEISEIDILLSKKV